MTVSMRGGEEWGTDKYSWLADIHSNSPLELYIVNLTQNVVIAVACFTCDIQNVISVSLFSCAYIYTRKKYN